MGVIIVILGFVSYCLFSELFEGCNYRSARYLGSLTLFAFGMFFGFLYCIHYAIELGISNEVITYCLVVIGVLSVVYQKFKHHFHA